MPKTSEKAVTFCCEAAFTGELLSEFIAASTSGENKAGSVFSRKRYREYLRQ